MCNNMFFDVFQAFLCHYLFKVKSASDHLEINSAVELISGLGGGGRRGSGKKRVHSIPLEIEKVLKGTSSN
jgi:hypothetical protein